MCARELVFVWVKWERVWSASFYITVHSFHISAQCYGNLFPVSLFGLICVWTRHQSPSSTSKIVFHSIDRLIIIAIINMETRVSDKLTKISIEAHPSLVYSCHLWCIVVALSAWFGLLLYRWLVVFARCLSLSPFLLSFVLHLPMAFTVRVWPIS